MSNFVELDNNMLQGKLHAYLKDTLWVLAPSTLGLCLFPHIFAVNACKLT